MCAYITSQSLVAHSSGRISQGDIHVLNIFSQRLTAWNSEKLREEMLLVQSTSWFLAYHVNPLITIPKMRAFSAPQNVCPSRKSSLWAFLSIDHLYVCQLFKFSKNLLLIFASIKIDNKQIPKQLSSIH